jgi:fatty acid desaturase
MERIGRKRRVEWPTFGLLTACYGIWGASVWLAAEVTPWALVVCVLCVTLHGSLQHEALHGHPTRSLRLNEALVFPALGLVFPYRRFKTLHLRHHNNDALTDPYDDPESFFYAMGQWARLPGILRLLLRLNNTLAGRITLGPAISAFGFLGAEACRLLRREPGVARAWVLHAGAVAIVYLFVSVICGLPFWLYAIGAAYPGLSLLMLRTFAEHRASERVSARTAIIEDSGLLSLLFLNNNLHLVHHENPRVPWYDLPALYRSRREAFRDATQAYCFRGYGEIARRYLFRAKQPVPHPFLRTDG